MPSLLEQYRIADFLDWKKEKRLELNPDFQRGSVWSPGARIFLIDTILRRLPIPKVYIRTRINVTTKKSIREVVDGQQRLRAIIDFAEDKLVLSKRAGEFKGLRYSTLDPKMQEAFLGYPIAVDQLVNAEDDDVLEVFARLNSYTVTLNPAEKRHAKYQGDFKWAIRASSRRWAKPLWEQYKVLTVRERVRMQDDSLTAEMIGVLLHGVTDGGQDKINKLYSECDAKFESSLFTKLDVVLKFLADKLAADLVGTPVLRPAHLLMLFSALAAILEGIPIGDLTPAEAKHPKQLPKNLDHARNNLMLLASIIDSDAEPPRKFLEFWKASRATTQRIASRRVRFPMYVRALTVDDIEK